MCFHADLTVTKYVMSDRKTKQFWNCMSNADITFDNNALVSREICIIYNIDTRSFEYACRCEYHRGGSGSQHATDGGGYQSGSTCN